MLSAGWTLRQYRIDDEVAAEALQLGTEVHVTFNETLKGKLFTRRHLRAALAPLFEGRSFLTTRVQRARTDQQAFVTRIGFAKTWEDPMFIYYMLDALPFERKPK